MAKLEMETKINSYMHYACLFQFALIGRDRGLPQRSSSLLEVTVKVDDVNDNKPYFPADKQSVEVSVREEEAGVSVANISFAQDLDDRDIFCYSIIGRICQACIALTTTSIKNRLQYKKIYIRRVTER